MRLSNLPEEIQQTYTGKTILISGAFGYIGSLLTSYLLGTDCRLVLLDKAGSIDWLPQDRLADCQIIQEDITERQAWEHSLPNVDYLFHLAALEYDRLHFNIRADLNVNGLAVAYCLDVCREKGYRPKIIFSSSANLFGLIDKLPVNEEHQNNPISLWSIHKDLAEKYLYYYRHKYGLCSVILRLANVYGPTCNPAAGENVVINRVIASALAGRPLKLYGNSECIRDYIYIDDVVRAFLFAGQDNVMSLKQKYYVIGSGEAMTIAAVWRLIADKVAAHLRQTVEIISDDSVELEPFDRRNFVAESGCFKTVSGWQPRVTLNEGIDLTINRLAQQWR